MSTSEKDLKKIAVLAYINLDADTEQLLANDIKSIMDFVQTLLPVDTSGVEPLLNPLDLQQRLRADEADSTSHVNALARLAPCFENGLYLVPKVIEIED